MLHGLVAWQLGYVMMAAMATNHASRPHVHLYTAAAPAAGPDSNENDDDTGATRHATATAATVDAKLAPAAVLADNTMESTTTTNSTTAAVPMPCTLVLVKPRTGRMHQIRRHAYHMGMPVLGDTEHGESRTNWWWRNHVNLHRLALHCVTLDLPVSFQLFTYFLWK